jgi:hypothetical protein
MCILIANGETLATGLSHAAAMREARVAARLFNTTVTVFNLKTKESTEWKN